MNHQHRSTLVALATAVATIVAIDVLVHQFSPAPALREARDGIRQLEQQNPETVVVGSSHARTFHDLGRVLAAEAPGRPPLVAIPLEFGKLTGYAWLMEHRVFPLLDEQTGPGRRRRDRVRRVIVLTEWWDSCGLREGEQDSNVPSRAWAVDDYVADVWQHGFTDYNRNFVREQFRHLFSGSVLVQRRGTGRILLDATRAIQGRASINSPERYASLVRLWQGTLEGGAACIGDRAQMEALERILDGVTSRGLEAVVVLFPRHPDTFTPKAIASTLVPFADLTRSVATPRGVRVIDLTTASPLKGSDFMDDFDHVSAGGNQLFAHWALANDLSFLKDTPGPAASAEAHFREAEPR